MIAEPWIHRTPEPESLAFLQYTSGSTGTPKGVMVSHANLLHNDCRTTEWLRFTPESKWVTWLPLHHDMGLIGGLLKCINIGIPISVLEPEAFLRYPALWLRTIGRSNATHTAAPNFAYDLCVRKVSPEQARTLNLTTLVAAANGAEPVRPRTVRDFAERFSDSGFCSDAFWPCYGLAEATLCVSAGYRGSGYKITRFGGEDLSPSYARHELPHGGIDLASSGPPIADQCLRIVDVSTNRPLPVGHIGEIWMNGPSVCQGYWGLKELTQEVFHARLPGDERDWLRTGDLGFLHEGELYITGRLKDMLILRGRNHYPQDIEHTIEEAAAGVVRPGCSAAFAVECDGEERLAVVAEIDPRHFLGPDDAAALVQRLRTAVASEHGIALHLFVLIPARTIPKTSSGKLQRRKCREDLLQGALQELGRWEMADAESPEVGQSSRAADERPVFDFASVSAALVRAMAQLTRQSQSQIDLNAALSSFGVDSLQAVELLADLEVVFGRAIPGDGIAVDMSLREIAQLIGDSAGASTVDRQQLESLLLDRIQRHAGRRRVDLAAPLSAYGIGVVTLDEIVADLEGELGQPLPADAVRTDMSIRKLAEVLSR